MNYLAPTNLGMLFLPETSKRIFTKVSRRSRVTGEQIHTVASADAAFQDRQKRRYSG
jgi:hypothetical protein